MFGITLRKRFTVRGGKIVEIEAGRHRGAQQGEAAAGSQHRTLPGVLRDFVLQGLSPENIGSQGDALRCAVFKKIEHLHGITQVKMKDLIGG